jgi:hypothetical protein
MDEAQVVRIMILISKVSALAHAWGRPKTCPDIFMTVIFPS